MASKADIKAIATQYVLETLQQQDKFTPSYDNMRGLVDQIGKRVYLDGNADIDHLPEMDGERMANGRIIEEYFLGFIAPTKRDKNAGYPTAAYPAKKKVYFNYPMDEQVFQTTIAYQDLEKARVSPTDAGSIVARILDKQNQSLDFVRYDFKKQLLANFIGKATTATNKARLCTEMAKPTDTATGEKFIRQLKDLVRAAKFVNSDNLSNEDGKGTSNLTLYVKPGILSSLEVDTEAGAFNLEKLAPGCTIKELDGFGNADESVYAVLLNPDGIKLHENYRFNRNEQRGKAGAYDDFLHWAGTGFISGYTYIHVFKEPA